MSLFKSNRIIIALSLVLIGFKLWLVTAHYLMATTTPHDDLLFVSQAHDILGGNWLGTYNQLTLIKGPFYPLFIALSYYLNIPLLLSQQLLYLSACVLTVLAIAPLIKQKWLLFLFFALLLLNPFSYNYPAVGRVLRLGIYMSLGLATFSCFLGLVVRRKNSWYISLVWALGAGLFLAAFWHTREESIWLLPSLLLLLIPAITYLFRLPRSRMLLMASIYALPFVMLFWAHHLLTAINHDHYDVAATIELETPEFKSAYGGLLRIESEHWRQYFPVVHDVRQQAYYASPTFNELRPYLDGEIGEKWKNLCGCDDIPAAFFIWAFRDSVAAAGYYTGGPDALAFYRRMGEEIDQACAEGELECRPRVTSLIPAWHREFNALLLPTFYSVLQKSIGFTDFSASTDGMISQGREGIMFMFEVVTREKLLPSHRDTLENYPEYYRHLDTEKIRILNDIGAAYQIFTTPLFLGSLIIFMLILGRSIVKKELSLITVASGAALGGVLSIAFILSLLSITSYSEIERAMHSTYPMVLLFIAMVILDTVDWLTVRRKTSIYSDVSEP